MPSLPRFLFHGTNKPYLEEQIEKYGIYKHDPNTEFGDVQLTDSAKWATNKACEQSMYRKGALGPSGEAVVLVVDTRKVMGEIKAVPGKWLTTEIPPSAYEIVPTAAGYSLEVRATIERVMHDMD